MNYLSGLVDTNILVYASDDDSIFQSSAQNFLEEVLAENKTYLAIQNLTEFYAIVTNSKRLKHPLSQSQALKAIESFIDSKLFRFVYATENTIFGIVNILKKFPIKAEEIHDVHLAAVALANNIRTIYTADTKVFTRLGLKAINPLD